MASSINYRVTLFKRASLTPICVEPTLKTLHKLLNEIKANAKSVYSNLRGGAHGHLGLLLTGAQYALILNTKFIYPTHPIPLVVADGTIAHINLNMRITHTKSVRLFCEVMGVENSPIQQIIVTVEEIYLANIRNRTTNSINYTVADILTHLEDNYGKLMAHKILDREDTAKKTIYHPRELITYVFSIVKELLEFTNITGTS